MRGLLFHGLAHQAFGVGPAPYHTIVGAPRAATANWVSERDTQLYHYREIVKGRRPAHNNRVYDALLFVRARKAAERCGKKLRSLHPQVFGVRE